MHLQSLLYFQMAATSGLCNLTLRSLSPCSLGDTLTWVSRNKQLATHLCTEDCLVLLSPPVMEAGTLDHCTRLVPVAL